MNSQIKQQTRIEFLNTINYRQEHSPIMAKNTSLKRKFFSAKINGQWWHGFWDKEDAEKEILNFELYE